MKFEKIHFLIFLKKRLILSNIETIRALVD